MSGFCKIALLIAAILGVVYVERADAFEPTPTDPTEQQAERWGAKFTPAPPASCMGQLAQQGADPGAAAYYCYGRPNSSSKQVRGQSDNGFGWEEYAEHNRRVVAYNSCMTENRPILGYARAHQLCVVYLR